MSDDEATDDRVNRHQMSDKCVAFGDIHTPENTKELDFSWLLHHTVYWVT